MEAMSCWFERLEQEKAGLLSGISSWPEKLLRFRPGPAAWSTLDVLDHLVKVEKGFLSQVRSSLPEQHAVSIPGRLRAMMVNAVMRSSLRVKVPAGAEVVLPDNSADFHTIVAGWDETRRDLGDLVRTLKPDDLRRGAFRHPVSGWMAPPQGMAFLSAHLRHHRYQLDRLKRATSRL